MKAGDWVAAGALLASLIALGISLWNRRSDIKRKERADIRARVWSILSMEPGIRTVLALDEVDGNTSKRIKLLKRTAVHLRVAGAGTIGDELDQLLTLPWGSTRTRETLDARDHFVDSVVTYMEPEF